MSKFIPTCLLQRSKTQPPSCPARHLAHTIILCVHFVFFFIRKTTRGIQWRNFTANDVTMALYQPLMGFLICGAWCRAWSLNWKYIECSLPFTTHRARRSYWAPSWLALDGWRRSPWCVLRAIQNKKWSRFFHLLCDSFLFIYSKVSIVTTTLSFSQ